MRLIPGPSRPIGGSLLPVALEIRQTNSSDSVSPSALDQTGLFTPRESATTRTWTLASLTFNNGRVRIACFLAICSGVYRIPEQTSDTVIQCFHEESQALHWMETCINTHPTCPNPGGFLPTRVLKSSKGPRARVKETTHEDKNVHYAALSYCWGGDQALLLTLDTIDELSTIGLSQENLPRTIADAITVAIVLGIQHLWVDALCILQNDSVIEAEWCKRWKTMVGHYSGRQLYIDL
ncbi:hypothetical protein QBC32DRAFT_205825 [Pseudoneurospora amorphoporcata]|uniref:Heterokaryon incompatibility domain-containing protein n=1 Tax=Pseudoneurospora amorphoporcata TaxID=241081 RepID=A0AAN6P3Z4_9PEZI|nr:hypothetical protein QBC32DRAFT_205825 [Pseudoneurospora amorphoporcata]